MSKNLREVLESLSLKPSNIVSVSFEELIDAGFLDFHIIDGTKLSASSVIRRKNHVNTRHDVNKHKTKKISVDSLKIGDKIKETEKDFNRISNYEYCQFYVVPVIAETLQYKDKSRLFVPTISTTHSHNFTPNSSYHTEVSSLADIEDIIVEKIYRFAVLSYDNGIHHNIFDAQVFDDFFHLKDAIKHLSKYVIKIANLADTPMSRPIVSDLHVLDKGSNTFTMKAEIIGFTEKNGVHYARYACHNQEKDLHLSIVPFRDGYGHKILDIQGDYTFFENKEDLLNFCHDSQSPSENDDGYTYIDNHHDSKKSHGMFIKKHIKGILQWG